ncbi:MAG: MFS transporter, partial [Dehalococcoidia bacterium]
MTATAAPATSARRWWTLVAMTLPLMILNIDFFGITVALPSIGRDLNADTSSLGWVINGFMLAFAAPQIAVGRLGDIYGRRMVLLAGLAIFAVASALAGVAQEVWWLIAARVAQGLGTAIFFVSSLSIVSNVFPRSERGVGIGVWTAVGAVGSSIGPLVGGFLSEGLSWRWFFYVNVPIAVIAMIMTLLVVQESRDETAPRSIDIRGLATLTAGLVLIVFGIQTSGAEGWRSALVLGPIGAGVVLLALFLLIEPRVRNPLIDFALFRSRNFAGAVGAAFIGNWVFGAVMFFLTLYLQQIRDQSPVRAGATFLMFTVPYAALSPVAGRAMRPIGVRWSLLVGMTLIVISSVLFAMIDVETGIVLILAALLIFAIGEAFAYNVST